MNLSLLGGRTRPVAAPRCLPAVALGSRQLWSETLRVGERVRCEGGLVWLTQSGDATDYLLRAGESFTAQRRGRVVVQALEPASLCVENEKFVRRAS